MRDLCELCTEFVVLGNIFPIYELRKNNFPHGGISKMFFPKLLFTINFKPKIVILDTDSILREKGWLNNSHIEF